MSEALDTAAVQSQHGVSSVDVLLHLARRARHAASAAELGFIVVNETHALAPYRQAALWFAGSGVRALSGVVSPEANAPFVHWLDRVATSLAASNPADPLIVSPEALTPEDATEWDDWLSQHAIWIPVNLPDSAGGLLLSRDEPWLMGEVQLLAEWADIWRHAWQGKYRIGRQDKLLRLFQRPRPVPASGPADMEQPGATASLGRLPYLRQRLLTFCAETWRSPARRYATLALLCLLIPVRITVLVPGELVPANPASIRAPLDGTVDRFFITPNQLVKAGTPLFQLDLTTLGSKLDVARQGLATAEAEYRQAAQQAVFDARSKAQLASLQGHIAERRAETEFLQAQLARAQVVAPHDGVALVDEPSEWIGKPVVTGERVMTIADEHDVEVEAWLSPADAIDLPDNAAVKLYLNSSPLEPVSATLRYAAHEATLRPDGSFAYRVRAVLARGEKHPRVGLKGSARVSGNHVPVIYWLLRRPLAAIRPWIGL